MKGSKISSWVSSSFDEFGDFGEDVGSRDRGKKRSREDFSQEPKQAKQQQTKAYGASKVIETDQLWADKYAPKSTTDLAVHKKKIAELQGWFEFSLKRNSAIKQAPMLLLTGPSGAGKTATTQALANELSIEVQEWVNPVERSSYQFSSQWSSQDYQDDFVPVGGRTSESQTVLFNDFLLRANKYQTLQIFGGDNLQKKIILIEDFPNLFFRDASQFHSIIRKYSQKGHCPLVFIVSDSAGGDSNERLLFPKHVQAELNIHNISFNPINMTSMVKALSNIASLEAALKGKRSSVPGKQTLEALHESSAGDIRGAINALQFACLKDTRDLGEAFKGASTLKKASSKKGSGLQKTLLAKSKTKSKGKKAKTSPDEREESLASIGGRDTSLFLFRALGKILYCKRGDKKDFPDHRSLPDSVSHLNRDPLLVNPEEVLEKSHLSGDFFSAFLQQNYLDFYNDIDDVVNASEYVSDADFLTVDWVSRAEMRAYSASVSSRALMFCNSARATSSGTGSSGLGFKPLHKPQWFATTKKVRENKETARVLFRKCNQTPVELQTQYLPYVMKINPRIFPAAQSSYLENTTAWQSASFRHRIDAQRLDERDVELGEDNDAESQLPGGASNTQESETAEEIVEINDPDIVIEDFDDD